MTTVEFFDRTPIENIISALTVVPDKIIFIGDNHLMGKNKAGYEAFLAHRNLSVPVEYIPIKKNELSDIVAVLSKIVEEEDECVFDLTGGEDLVLVAMGVVSTKYAHKNVRMQRFNIQNGKVADCDGDGNVLYEGEPKLSVDEQILLHGGKVRYEENSDGRTYPWEITEDFINDVNLMWAQCRKNPGLWNSQINILEIAASYSDDISPLEAAVNYDTLRGRLQADNVEEKDLNRLLLYLEKNGLIRNFVEDTEKLTFTFKNQQVKKCLTNAGLILEMKVYVTALTVTHKKSDKLYYSDALNGVHIDWDGEFHQRGDTEKDTENEVDVIVMDGLVPVFISCKNGQFKEDELYKLDAVANRFGGKYAKRIMIISYWSKKSPNPDHFRKRAIDMKVNLIDHVHTLTDSEFEKMIRHMINYTT